MSDPNNFESPNFDPIAYLNQRFPNEASLAGLDDEIQKLNRELSEVNGDLIKEIHEHAMMNVHVTEEITKARELSKEVIKEIGIIKEKATKSEEIVYEMCKDLKSLDIAKRNLTFSIDALKKFIMMVDAVEKLRDACEKRQYKEVSMLLSAFNELSNHFKKYESIPQIQDLYKDRNAIVTELSAQITEDFEAFDKGTSLLKPEEMHSAALVLEVLGQKAHRKFTEDFCKLVLEPYQQLYSQAENSVLDNTQRRYGWIRRKMEEMDAKYTNVFPEHWGMPCYVLYEFCSITRLHLTGILERTASTVSVAVLMKSLQVTLRFEDKTTTDLKKKFQKLFSATTRIPFAINSLPKFKGSISNSFQPHLKPYIRSEQQALYELVTKNLEQDTVLTDIKVYNSSLCLFHGIMAVVKRASAYSKGMLMMEIVTSIKRILIFYCERCAQKIRKSGDFEAATCWVVNTGERCKNILADLRENIEANLDPANVQQLNFNDEEETFSKLLISKPIDNFILHMEQKFEEIFSQMVKINWDKADDNVDVSFFVKQADALLSAHFMKIKGEMNTTYLAYYLNKVVVLVNSKFINNVYKCKKLPNIAFQTMQLDISQLKEMLFKLVKSDPEAFGSQKNVQGFRNFVNKTFLKSENVIKLLTLGLEGIAQRFDVLFQGGTLADLDKILFVKGAKRSDVSALVKKLQNREK